MGKKNGLCLPKAMIGYGVRQNIASRHESLPIVLRKATRNLNFEHNPIDAPKPVDAPYLHNLRITFSPDQSSFGFLRKGSPLLVEEADTF